MSLWGNARPVEGQLELELPLAAEPADPEPEPEPWVDDGVSWHEWITGLPPLV